MNGTNKQLRGHCPHCGAVQAIADGVMVHHGYRVKWNSFLGTCSAARTHAPIETSRDAADAQIALLLAEADHADERAAKIEAGELKPTSVSRGFRRDPEIIPFADAHPWEQRDAVNSLLWKTKCHAKAMRDGAKCLADLVRDFHGKPLVEVDRSAKPEAIERGDRRADERGVILTAERVESRRVYYTFPRADGTLRRGWLGLQAWRRLAAA